VSARPDGVHWDGIEYYSKREGRGVLYAFRGSAPGETSHRFRLAGLAVGKRYRLRFEDEGARTLRTESGEALMQEGVEVHLATPLSAEIVSFKRLHPRDIERPSGAPGEAP